MIQYLKSFIKEYYKFLIVLLAIFLLFRIELPYKVYTPGGMIDLGSRIKVDDGYESDGKLGMAYVSVVNGSIPFLLASYIIPNWDIVSDDLIKYDNQTMKEAMQIDKLAMEEAVNNATLSAYHKANKDILVTNQYVHVTYIDKEAQTDVKLFDIILEIDGVSINNLDEMRAIVENQKEGDKVSLKILRDNKEITKEATVYNTSAGLKIGIGVTTTYEYTETPKIEIKTKAAESGPSGGLMMSLAIYNALTEEDITKGKKIIGTGTIDAKGNVGSIGGVKYKLLGAVNKKCDIFLVPKDNYEEANEVKNEKNLNIELISVNTLDEAIDVLKNM